MQDLISRQAAIDAINHICPVDTECDCTLLDRVDVRYVLSDLPSAEPVRHGKWMPREEGKVYPFWERYTCSECGEHSDDKRYCPNCGCRMDGERKEE